MVGSVYQGLVFLGHLFKYVALSREQYVICHFAEFIILVYTETSFTFCIFVICMCNSLCYLMGTEFRTFEVIQLLSVNFSLPINFLANNAVTNHLWRKLFIALSHRVMHKKCLRRESFAVVW